VKGVGPLDLYPRRPQMAWIAWLQLIALTALIMVSAAVYPAPSYGGAVPAARLLVLR